ncbi:hypothetical protein [Treponema pedis]|uniref:hypothetical protein n=1 Tax=Treponema pedis TaxID=409322 RepID=UPI003141E505
MEKKNKRYFIFGIVFAILLAAGIFFAINGRRNTSDIERSGIDPGRIERVENNLDNVGNGIERAEGKISNARSEVTKSLAVIGEVGSGFDTIESGIRDCKNRIENIERRNNRIEQIIREAKKRKNNLDDGGN